MYRILLNKHTIHSFENSIDPDQPYFTYRAAYTKDGLSCDETHITPKCSILYCTVKPVLSGNLKIDKGLYGKW